jgi:hypothetical protein
MSEPRFVIEPDPEKSWRHCVRDTRGEFDTKSFASRADAKREHKRLENLCYRPEQPVKQSSKFRRYRLCP